MSDGKDHINAYSKGVTELGRALSNFARVPVYLSEMGHFESIEGLWYYLGLQHMWGQPDVEQLRELYGFHAKSHGQYLRSRYFTIEIPEFQSVILEATALKVKTPAILPLYLENGLPFTHYYVLPKGVISVSDSNKFQIDFLNRGLRVYYNLPPLA